MNRMIFLGTATVIIGIIFIIAGLNWRVSAVPRAEAVEDCGLIEDAVLKVYIQHAPSGSDAAEITYAKQILSWADTLPKGCQRAAYIKWANASERNAMGERAQRQKEESERQAAVNTVLNNGTIIMPPQPIPSPKQ